MKFNATAPRRLTLWRIAPLFCAAFVCPITVVASSHSDAPLIKQDPQANLTDVYTFVGTKYNDPSVHVLNVLVSVRPFSDPGDGVIYERFADDAVYSIHLTDPVTGKLTQQFDFEFSSITDVKNPDTILSYGRGTGVGPIVTIGDAQQNFTQTYDITASKVSGKGRNARLREVFMAKALPVAPPNVGARTTPAYNGPDGKAVSGAVDFAGLDSLTKQAISPVDNGIVAWAGPREDGFYADTPGIFDFLDPRIVNNDGDGTDGLGQDGSGVDGFKGFNVLTFAVQIPLTELEPVAYQAPLLGARTGVGRSAGHHRTHRPRGDLPARRHPRGHHHRPREAARPGRVQPPQLDRRRYRRLAERPPHRRRRRGHRALRGRQRPELQRHHHGRRQRRCERRDLQPGLPLPRHAARWLGRRSAPVALKIVFG